MKKRVWVQLGNLEPGDVVLDTNSADRVIEVEREVPDEPWEFEHYGGCDSIALRRLFNRGFSEGENYAPSHIKNAKRLRVRVEVVE